MLSFGMIMSHSLVPRLSPRVNEATYHTCLMGFQLVTGFRLRELCKMRTSDLILMLYGNEYAVVLSLISMMHGNEYAVVHQPHSHAPWE